MVKPAYMIAIAAVLLAASFAGVVLIDDEADATGDVPITSVTFEVYDADGDKLGSVMRPVSGEEYTIPTPEDVGLGDVAVGFEYWTDDSKSLRYYPDSIFVLKGASDSITLRYDIEAVSTINFVVDGKVVDTMTPEEAVKGTLAESAIYVPESKDGYMFVGWQLNDTSKTVYADAKAIVEAVNAEESALVLKAEDVFTAVYEKIITLTWQYEDGKSIDTFTNKDGGVLGQPADPTFDNHVFVGWKPLGGDSITIKAGEKLDLTKVEESVTYIACFEPVKIAVTFTYGETSATVYYSYGALIEYPVPEGYECWGTIVKETAEDGTVTEKFVPYDMTQPVSKEMTLVAQESEPTPVIPDEGYDVEFVKMIDGETIAINTITITEQNPTVTIPTGDAIAVDGKEFIGWFVGTQQVNPATYEITEDVTFVAMYRDAPEPVPEEPAFYETNVGMIAIFLVIVVIAAFIYAYMTNAYGLKDKLSFKIVRNGGNKKE